MISIPFSGSKRNYVRPVEELVKDNGYTAVYEPFGGSAVLSVNLYNDGLVRRARINDYDGLFDIYPAYLDIKDKLIKECLDYGMKKGKKRLKEEQLIFLQNEISKIDKKYYPLLANNFVFSGRVTNGNLKPEDFCYFFNEIGTEKQRYYLSIVNQLERSTLDYRDFLEKYRFEYNERSLIILDPPYLNSYQKQYKNNEFFGLAETLEMLECAKKTGADFLYFNMIEKDTRKLLEVLGFNILDIKVKHLGLNYSTKREDILAFISQQNRIKHYKIA